MHASRTRPVQDLAHGVRRAADSARQLPRRAAPQRPSRHLVQQQLRPAATCITQSGKTACGYHCVAAHGEVARAHTAAGICDSNERKIVCRDPSDNVRAHYGDSVPSPDAGRGEDTTNCYDLMTSETFHFAVSNPDWQRALESPTHYRVFYLALHLYDQASPGTSRDG